MTKYLLTAAIATILVACNNTSDAASAAAAQAAAAPAAAASNTNRPFTATAVAEFNEPWAMTFLPDGRLLVTEKKGRAETVRHRREANRQRQRRADGRLRRPGRLRRRGAASAVRQQRPRLPELCRSRRRRHARRAPSRARKLTLDGKAAARCPICKVIWRQVPKVDGDGHFGHRIAFGPDGKLWISSSERQKFDPAQDMKSQSRQDRAPQRRRLGARRQSVRRPGRRHRADLVARPSQPARHRLRCAGPLWEHEMGPQGGDELNLHRARRELRLSDRLERRPLRWQGHSRSRHAPGIQRAGSRAGIR